MLTAITAYIYNITTSFCRSSSHTPNSNSITPCNSDSSRSSDEWQKISEADEIFARQIYESDLKVQKLEQQRKKEDYARYILRRKIKSSTVLNCIIGFKSQIIIPISFKIYDLIL